MAGIDVGFLRAQVAARGFNWQANELPPGFIPRPTGLDPTPADIMQPMLNDASLLATTRFAALFRPNLTTSAAPSSGPAPMRSKDWRTNGVIGPVTDQRWCGSCVSFATTGLVGAMIGVEHAATSIHLSEGDEHFCSSHGATCGGWNNGDALQQIRLRGVVADADLVYMTSFDNPPVGNPQDVPDHLWIAHSRGVADRDRKTYHVNEVTAWNGDDRKTYLANIGPMVCGFTVFEDFDHYGVDAVGVYRHVTGNSRGGHAVLVVGFSDAEQCWICRNSWGSTFGGAAKADGVGAGFFKIGYGECNIDGAPFYGARGVTLPASSNWGGWWQVAGGVAAAGTSVFGVSRSADKLDILCVGTDHGTYTAAWQPGDAAWQGWWHVQGGVAAPNSSVTAVTRSADKLDIFCVGTDHRIFTAAWQAGDTAWRGWWPVAGGVAAPNTSVFGVSRSADKLDIFCVGTDHAIYTAAWQPGDTVWGGWWPVQKGVAAPDTSVSAITRSPDKLDIFCVGTNHQIYTAAWQAGDTTWRGWWPVAGGIAAPGTSVFGCSRSLDKLDIFCIGTDMRVYTAAWQAGDTAWRGWWPVGEFKAAAGTSVFAVSRAPDHLDIFAVGADGGIYTAAWQPGDTAWRGWWHILGGASAPNTSVTAVVRSANHLDVFAVGTDNHIYTAAWQA